MLTDRQIAQRRHDARNSTASQRLEGLEPDVCVLAQIEQYITGELELGEIIEDFTNRAARGEIRIQT